MRALAEKEKKTKGERWSNEHTNPFRVLSHEFVGMRGDVTRKGKGGGVSRASLPAFLYLPSLILDS